MLKKLSFLLVGFFCSGMLIALAATQQSAAVTANTPGQTQQSATATPNTDSFNFVIANPNTIDPKRFIFEIKPGEMSHDNVLIKNASDIPLTFSFYGADGTKTSEGTFALKTKNEPMKDLGNWITFDQKQLVLQPGEVKKIGFSVNVPAGTPEGTYSGGVAAEKTKPDTKNPNIIIAVRIALRVDVKVTSDPQPIPKKYSNIVENPFFQVYFWISAILFLGSAGYLIWTSTSGKKRDTKRGPKVGPKPGSKHHK